MGSSSAVEAPLAASETTELAAADISPVVLHVDEAGKVGLKFRRVSVKIKDKQILNEVSFEAQAGRLLAIMGATGIPHHVSLVVCVHASTFMFADRLFGFQAAARPPS
jgi:ATPase subunit of ABC transporter with duplicated ATPase domains